MFRWNCLTYLVLVNWEISKRDALRGLIPFVEFWIVQMVPNRVKHRKFLSFNLLNNPENLSLVNGFIKVYACSFVQSAVRPKTFSMESQYVLNTVAVREFRITYFETFLWHAYVRGYCRSYCIIWYLMQIKLPY